jgi:hypothetical protein
MKVLLNQNAYIITSCVAFVFGIITYLFLFTKINADGWSIRNEARTHTRVLFAGFICACLVPVFNLIMAVAFIVCSCLISIYLFVEVANGIKDKIIPPKEESSAGKKTPECLPDGTCTTRDHWAGYREEMKNADRLRYNGKL